MYKHKVIETLKTFTPDEFKRFEKFIRSPYFNTAKDTVKLFDFIKKHYPSFDSSYLELSKAAKKLKTKGEASKEARIRNILTALYQLAETFLSVEHFKADEFKIEEAKVYQFRKRKLEGLYEKTIDKVIGENKEINSMYKDNYSSLIDLYGLRVQDVIDKMKLNKGAEDISRQSEYIALSFLYRAFSAKESTMVNRHNFNVVYPDVSAAIFDSIDFEKVLNYVKENSKEIYPVVALTYYAHKVFLVENLEENLKAFEKIYEGVKSKLDKKFHYELLCTINNAFLYKLNHIKVKEQWESCIKKSFEIHKFMDEEDLYPKDEIFDAGDFKIIADTAVFTGNQEWSLMFIEKYKHLLLNEVRDDAVNYASACLYLKMRSFEKALYHFNLIKKADFITLWQMKTGQGICHYELGNFETVLSLCDSTSVELKRKYKNYDGHDLQMEFFVRLRKMTKLRMHYSKRDLQEFEIFLKASIEKYGEGFFFENQIKEIKKLFGEKKLKM